MSDARITIMPVAAALGALAANLPATPAQAAMAPQASEIPQPASQTVAHEPNTFVSTGQDLLGFMVDRQADGTLVAYHTSHASHASHASHYSSR